MPYLRWTVMAAAVGLLAAGSAGAQVAGEILVGSSDNWSATGGRTVTTLQLQIGIGGVWDTSAPNSYWLLGVARSLDEPLLNDVMTMAVNVSVADGGLLTLFASDYLGGMGFASGRILTVTATFSDGTSAVGVVVTQ